MLGERGLFSGLVPLFVVAHFAHHLLNALPAPLLPLIRNDFRLDYTRAGLVVSVFSLAYGIGQLPAGWLADRIGPRILITIGICGVALAGLAVGLSRSYIMMVVFLALMGVAGGGYHPSAVPLISTSVESKNQGRALGIHQIGGSASFFMAPLAAVTIATAWGWRSSFIGLAIPATIFGIVFYILLGRRATNKSIRTKAVNPKEISPSSVHWRRLVAFMVLSIFTQAITSSTISFIPLFMVDNFGIGADKAGAFLSIIYSAGLWVSPLSGYLSDKLGRVSVMLVVCLINGPLIYLLNLAPYGLGFSALLLMVGIVTYTRMPVSESYIVRQASEHRRSTVLGIYYFGGMEAGAVLTPLVGSLIDRFGFSLTFNIASAIVVGVTLICAVLLRGSRD